jgi:hypothetical protein
VHQERRAREIAYISVALRYVYSPKALIFERLPGSNLLVPPPKAKGSGNVHAVAVRNSLQVSSYDSAIAESHAGNV